MRLPFFWILSSFLLMILISITSLLGLFNSLTYVQETTNWALQAKGQDIGNLIAVFMMLVSVYYVKKGSFSGFLIWLGVLLYVIYAYLIYAFFVHFNYLFLFYVAILGVAFYTTIGGVLSQNISTISKPYIGVRTGLVSLVLILTGILFGVLWLSEIISSLISGQPPKSIVAAGLWVNPIQVIDLAIVLPGMVITGILLLRKHAIGYLFGAPWLTFSVLMGSSIVVNMVLELRNGNMQAIVPMTIVGVIVVFSIVALYNYSRQRR